MKSAFIIFFSIVLTVYGSVNFYIFIRGWQALPQNPNLRIIYPVLFILLSLSFLGGRILEKYWMSGFSDALILAGAIWLAAMVYFFFAVVLIDLTRLINHFADFIPVWSAGYDNLKFIVMLSVILITGLVTSIGYINAKNPVVNTLEIKINKKAGYLKDLNIVMVSDIHLGTIISNSRFEKIVGIINGLNPDVVLLAGDIVDEDIVPVIKKNLGETLKNIKSKYGVFGITGNHEYIGGVENACEYLSAHNVRMLRDTAVLVDKCFYIAGREDKDIKRFRGQDRKPLEEILNGADKDLPLIVMNHQPTGFDEAVKAGADLHLSGHTHNGQMWPFNYITQKIYELSMGYLQKENTHFFVSCGVGTWGPPVRLGNRPEIVNIKLSFD